MEEYKILKILEVLKFRARTHLDDLLILRAIEEGVAANNNYQSGNDGGIEYELIAKEPKKKSFLKKLFSFDEKVTLHLGNIDSKHPYLRYIDSKYPYFTRFSPHLPSYGWMEGGKLVRVEVHETQFNQFQSCKDAIVVPGIDTILLYHNDNSRK